MMVIMVYKPTYNWGAPSCGGLHIVKSKMVIHGSDDLVPEFFGNLHIWSWENWEQIDI